MTKEQFGAGNNPVPIVEKAMSKAVSKAKRLPISQRISGLVVGGIATTGMWAFGLSTVALMFQHARLTLMKPDVALSVFGASADGRARDAWGLTFGGPGQSWFSQYSMTGVLEGMEGPLLAVGWAMLVMAGLMLTLINGRGAKTAGPLVVGMWGVLWLSNAGRLAVAERDPALAGLTILLIAAMICCYKRLQVGLKSY